VCVSRHLFLVFLVFCGYLLIERKVVWYVLLSLLRRRRQGNF